MSGSTGIKKCLETFLCCLCHKLTKTIKILNRMKRTEHYAIFMEESCMNAIHLKDTNYGASGNLQHRQ